MVEFLIKDLFCIFSSNFVGICHPLISIGLCHLCTGIALITSHILIQCLLFCQQFYQTRTHEQSISLTFTLYRV